MDNAAQKLLQEMIDETNSYGREPEAHQNADDLLINAIYTLATECDKEEWAKNFVAAYKKVGKWYE